MQGLLELSGIPYAGCDVQSSALCMDKSLAYVVAGSAGIATPNFWTVAAERDRRPGLAHLSRLREAGPLGFVLRRQQGVRRGRTGGRGGDRAAVRLEGADRRGRRRQRGRVRHPGQRARTCSPARWTGSRCRTASSGSTRRTTPESGSENSTPIVPADIPAEAARARPGDGEGHLPRPGLPGAGPGRHVPQGGRHGGPQRGQHPARPDLLQPLPEDDGRRRAAARRSDRPDGVAGAGREAPDERRLRLRGRAGARDPLGRQVRHLGQLHRQAGGRLPRRTGSSARGPCAPPWNEAQEKAASLGFGLLLWDGYRPQRAVDCFLRWSEQPEDGRTKPRHYPNIDRAEMFERGYVAARSGHSRGSTVDLTLYHLATGELAAMGGGHDLMDPISHHGARGITRAEAENRRALRVRHGGLRFRAVRTASGGTTA